MPGPNFNSLGDVGGNTFYGTLHNREGKTLLEQIRHHADEARAKAKSKPLSAAEQFHQTIMQLVRPQFSVAPIPGSAARPGGAMRFGGGAATASAAAHGAGPTYYAPRAPSPFQGGANGVPAHQAPATKPAVYAGIGGAAAAGGMPHGAAGSGVGGNGAPGATPGREANGSAAHPRARPSVPNAHEAHAPFEMWPGRPEQFTREEERMIIRALEEDSRLPPRGYTGFDPALTPAWAGRPMRF